MKKNAPSDSKSESESQNETTHFGYQQIPASEKIKRVGQVFSSVASRYDLMNDLMSLGIHRLWKKFAVEQCQLRSGDCVLDLAGGTGDLTKKFTKCVGDNGIVFLADINAEMLSVGRERLIDAGIIQKVVYTQVNAECLPFADNSFDCVCIAFGLRNVTHKERAIASMYRVLKPGGRLVILEFSKPVLPLLSKIYDRYSFAVLPRLGELIANDAPSYQYLVESIRMHPDQETLKKMIEHEGFDDVKYHNLSGGIVALHRAFKY